MAQAVASAQTVGRDLRDFIVHSFVKSRWLMGTEKVNPRRIGGRVGSDREWVFAPPQSSCKFGVNSGPEAEFWQFRRQGSEAGNSRSGRGVSTRDWSGRRPREA